MVNSTLRNVQASIRNLENPVRQLAKGNAKWPHGSHPSNTKANPNEQFKAIILRSSSEIEIRIEMSSNTGKGKLVVRDAASKDKIVIVESNSKGKEVQRPHLSNAQVCQIHEGIAYQHRKLEEASRMGIAWPFSKATCREKLRILMHWLLNVRSRHNCGEGLRRLGGKYQCDAV